MSFDEEPPRGEHHQCLHEIDRLRTALEQEALSKARIEHSTNSNAVGAIIVVGELTFVIGCDEHANMTATEWDGSKLLRALMDSMK